MKPGVLKAGLIGAAMLLAACSSGGDGGGGTTPAVPASILSGTAAAGAPLIGQVTVKDSSVPPRTKTVQIATNGSYSIDVSGMTPPFVLRAEGSVAGRSYHLHSGASQADINGTINVTPMTDLIIANIAGQIAANYFDVGNFSGLTPAALNAAETLLQNRLQPVLSALGFGASVDLLRAAFNPDHTGLDAALDVLRITVDPATNTATILNVLNNQQIIDDLTSQEDSDAVDATGTSAGLTEFQQILQRLEALQSFLATSLPAPTNPTLLSFFDTANFLTAGKNFSQFQGDDLSDPSVIGIKFDATLVALDSNAAPPTARIVLIVKLANGRVFGGEEWVVNKNGNVWQFAGDQKIVETDFIAYAILLPNTPIESGLMCHLQDQGLRGIDYALVKGKGLPTTTGGTNGSSAGLLLVNYPTLNPALAQASGFGMAQPPYQRGNTPLLSSARYSQLPLIDTDINLIQPNEVYTVELYEDGGTANTNDDTLLATYSIMLPLPPHKVATLTAASFPVITAPTPVVGMNVAKSGGNLTVQWILPAGHVSNQLHAFRFDQNGQFEIVRVGDSELGPNEVSRTIVIPPPALGSTIVGSGVNVLSQDSPRRWFTTALLGQ